MSEHEDLDKIETAIKKLRLAYEKYFAGVDRLEPIDERNRVKAALRRARAEQTVNTARRFRSQQLQATMITHESYWNRICRQIEEGTYKRHIAKAERLMAQRQALEAERKLARESAAADGDGAEPAPSTAATASPGAAKTATPPAAAKPAARTSAADGAPREDVKRLHAAYVKAQKTAGTDKLLSLEALARTVDKQTAALKERYKCDEVEFKVVLKGNKPVLKAIPK